MNEVIGAIAKKQAIDESEIISGKIERMLWKKEIYPVDLKPFQ